jgi:hypothetical protein
MGSVCAECGARYESPDDSCARRFEQLLALDHSRQEPWGSRHGLAFAVFALQHPQQYDLASRTRSFELLDRVIRHREALESVVREFRARGKRAGSPMPASAIAARPPFPVTIVDCGDFEATTYPDQLERWCAATLGHLTLIAT